MVIDQTEFSCFFATRYLINIEELNRKLWYSMSQRCNKQGDLNQLSSVNMDEKKSMLTSNINIPNVPATPPPTPTNIASPSLADRRNTIHVSAGEFKDLKSTGKGRVPDVIDSLGRRRSTSCCETLSESPKYVGSPFAVNGGSKSIKKSNSFFGEILSSTEGNVQVNTVADAKPTNSACSEIRMEICSEKEDNSVSAQMVVELHSETYNMDHPRRGYFVILNHDQFDAAGMDRPGSSVDAAELEIAAKFLGFQPLIYNNLTYEEIKTYIDKLAASDHSDADCLAIAVLTHGNAGGYLHSKDVLYPVDKLWTPFVAKKCPSLAGKPKLFFIQACRGDRLDSGITLRRTETDSGATSYKIPNNADFLISYSTVDGYYSWRNPKDGTWFVRSLCDELKSLVPQGKDLLKIMVRVHAKVAFQYQSFDDKDPSYDEKKQIPSFVCMLTRDLYFTPKKNQTITSAGLTS